jgi:leader peptidase (prepilin peptidase)/N-methyltransferase
MSARRLQFGRSYRPVVSSAGDPEALALNHELGFGIKIPGAVAWIAIAGSPLLAFALLELVHPSYSLSDLVAPCLLAIPLAALAVSDLRDGILPDAITGLVALGGLTAAWLQSYSCERMELSVLGALAGGGWLLAVRQAYLHLRKIEALGLGDVKLAAAGGACVGLAAVPQLVLLAVLISLSIAIAMRVADRRMTMSTRIPFGPGLAGATWAITADIVPLEAVHQWIS